MNGISRTGLLVVGAFALTFSAPSAPALAATSASCVITSGYSCSTGYINASSKVTLKVNGSTSGTVTCRVFDSGGNEVASLSNSSSTVQAGRQFAVPYATHFVSCVRPGTYGGGGGALYNW